MKHSLWITAFVLAALVASPVWAAETTIGSPDALVDDGTLTVRTTATSGFNTILVVEDTNNPANGSVRMRIQAPVAQFTMSAFGTRGDEFNNSAGLGAAGTVMWIGGQTGTPLWLYTDNNSPKNDPTASKAVYLTTTGRLGIGNKTPTKKLDVSGEIKCTVLNITGADLSEKFNVNGEAEPGTVVSIDTEQPGQLIVSSKAYDRTVAGIISGAGDLKIGVLMGQAGTMEHNGHPVALSGRVWCKVDASQAAVVPGDLLTTSNFPGHAMKVLDYEMAKGAVIGKAMTPLAEGKSGLVLVLVSLQ